MSEEMKKITLVYKPVPKVILRASEYDAILDEFVKSGKPSAILVTTGKVPKSLHLSLRNRIKKRNLSIKVQKIEGKTWLVRK